MSRFRYCKPCLQWTRQSLLPSCVRPTADWTAIRYDINNTWAQERRTFILPVSRTSVRLTRHGAIYLVDFLIRKNLKPTCILTFRSTSTENCQRFKVIRKSQWLIMKNIDVSCLHKIILIYLKQFHKYWKNMKL